MSIHEPESEIQRTPKRASWLRRRQRLLLKLGVGCLALFLVGHLVMAGVEKIQDMTDRAH